jgi:hypothetical protein
MGKMTNGYNISIGKPEGKRPFGTPVHRVGEILKSILKKWGLNILIEFR